MEASDKSTTDFQRRLNIYSKSIYEYKDPDWIASAKAVIPLDTLTDRVLKSMSEDSIENPPLSFEDELLKQLLAWFKHEFFKWVNEPECHFCTSKTQRVGNTAPTGEEAYFGAGVVEVYSCPLCYQYTRFPRYNHAQKLLETRKGRCGEWAQCFTLCAMALGYDVRMVHDWTDHVWNEVYSEEQGRWLHCDSCENAMDKPLLYETGWGKKLNYAIAVSTDEVLDVTPKYTKDYAEVLKRRNLVKEEWLAKHLELMTFCRINNVHVDRKMLIQKRLVTEREVFKKKFDSEKKAEEDEKDAHGRISGSVEWRAQRGELGDVDKTLLAEKKEEEIKNKLN